MVTSGGQRAAGSVKETEELPAIAITMGDPAGIGPEIVVKALTSNRFPACRPLVCGSPFELRRVARRLDIDAEVVVGEAPPAEASGKRTLHCHPAAIETSKPVAPGAPSAEGGRQALAAIETAVKLALGGTVDAMVTAPISKQAIHLAGASHPGHTEMLAELTDRREVAMMLVGGPLRVALVTIHEPLRRVADLVTGERIATVVRLTHDWLLKSGIQRPRLAVAGLNPHAGEGGDIGHEEQEVIAPAVSELRRQGLPVVGPLPADTLFHAAYRQDYDAVVCMYHDQGLAPLKMVAFETGVNVTLGLPFTRTSPDHGTAFDIAGRGVASPASLLAALGLAVETIGR